jgi:Protein of unknown function (DUF3800)
MPPARSQIGIMYLSYFDDSGSEPSDPICVFGGVVIPGDTIGHTEAWTNNIVEYLGLQESLSEFKASDLYFGTGEFSSVDKKKCRTAFLLLLSQLAVNGLPFIYSAIDNNQLKEIELFGSAHPVDVAFQVCLAHLEKWARSRHSHPPGVISVEYKDVCLVIADECDPLLKKRMLATFRKRRPRRHPRPGDDVNKRLFHIHDSMYFGDSRDSIGIQIADAANWAMHRHLSRRDLDADIIALLGKFSICAEVEPQWAQYKHLFKSHLDMQASG